MKILIAYDGSSSSDIALHDLVRAGLPQDAEAVVVSVAELWRPSTDQESGSSLGMDSDERAGDLAEAAALRLRGLFPGWTVGTEDRHGSPSREILRLEHQWQPDLIVVGSHGRSRRLERALGSVSQQTLTGAHCSVRIGRSESRQSDYPVRMLIGVDGAPDSEEAVREVASRRWPAGSRVWLSTAVGVSFDANDRKVRHDEAVAIHEHLAVILHEAGLGVTSLIDAIDPKQALVGDAEELEIDCIYLGARGHLPYERLLLGSVSASVASRAGCSVEVVRRRS